MPCAIFFKHECRCARPSDILVKMLFHISSNLPGNIIKCKWYTVSCEAANTLHIYLLFATSEFVLIHSVFGIKFVTESIRKQQNRSFIFCVVMIHFFLWKPCLTSFTNTEVLLKAKKCKLLSFVTSNCVTEKNECQGLKCRDRSLLCLHVFLFSSISEPKFKY